MSGVVNNNSVTIFRSPKTFLIKFISILSNRDNKYKFINFFDLIEYVYKYQEAFRVRYFEVSKITDNTGKDRYFTIDMHEVINEMVFLNIIEVNKKNKNMIRLTRFGEILANSVDISDNEIDRIINIIKKDH